MTVASTKGHDVAQLLLRVALAAIQVEDHGHELTGEQWATTVLELAAMPRKQPELTGLDVGRTDGLSLHAVLEALTAGVELVRAFVGG